MSFANEGSLVFQADQGKAASGCSLGLGIDGSWNSVVYEALDPAGFDMINSQVVALEDKSTTYTETRFLTTRAGFSGEVTLFGADFWGSAKHGVVVESGKMNLNLVNFSTSGGTSFMNFPKTTGTIVLHNAVVNMKDEAAFICEGHEKQASVTSTVTDVAAGTIDKIAVWEIPVRDSQTTIHVRHYLLRVSGKPLPVPARALHRLQEYCHAHVE